jgi:hypothetical protein
MLDKLEARNFEIGLLGFYLSYHIHSFKILAWVYRLTAAAGTNFAAPITSSTSKVF